MELNHILSAIIIAVITCFQLKFFIQSKIKISQFRKVFPMDAGKSLSIQRTDEDGDIEGLYSTHKNPVFTTVINSINNYLHKNRGAVSDFHLIKDITDRNCDIEEEEINALNPMPLYLGLMGTMAGILVGVSFLAFGGGLEALLDVSNLDPENNNITKSSQGIVQLLEGVGIAMGSSLMGIGLTSWNSMNFKNAKAIIEKNKNSFFTWVQVELLPELSSNTANALQTLSKNLSRFNNVFSDNTRELGKTLEQINVSYREQAEIIQYIEKLKIQKIATANIEVLKELQECTTEISQFNTYLHSVNDYTDRVQKLNENIASHLDRTKVIEDMGVFFRNEVTQIEMRQGLISRSVGQTDIVLQDALQKLQENTEQQFNELVRSTVKLHEGFGIAVDEQQEALNNKLRETSEIIAELKNLTDVKKSMESLEFTANQQNNKMDRLIAAVMEANTDVAPEIKVTPKFELPKNLKWIGGITLAIVSATCLFFLTIKVLSLFGIG